MKKMSVFMLVVLFLAVFAFSACSPAPAVQTDTATDKAEEDVAKEPVKEEFKVGMECGYAPFNWTQLDDSNGAVPIEGSNQFAGGYDVEIAKSIAEGLGKELVIVKTAWDGLVPALQSGVIDAIIAGMSPTEERKQTIDFSDNYYRSSLVIVVKKGSQYESAASISDFSGAKITAQLGTFHYTVIEQIEGVSMQTAMDDFPAMRVALESGIIDGYVSERPEGVSAAAANANFTFVEFAAEKGFQTSDDDVAIAVGIKKGQEELIASINKVLAGITEQQRIEIMDAAIVNQPAEQ
jgi:putative lysine transport system substrate-binding protein